MDDALPIIIIVALMIIIPAILGRLITALYRALARRGWVTPEEPELYYLRASKKSVSGVTDGELITLRGKLRLVKEQEPISAPFSGEPCAVSITTLEHYRHDPDSDRIYDPRLTDLRCVHSVLLEDGSGVARVHLPELRSLLRVVPDDTRARILEGVPIDAFEQFLTANRWTFASVDQGFPWGSSVLPGDFRLRQQLLRDGDDVMICGRAHQRPCAGPPTGGQPQGHYREAPLEVVIEAPGDQRRTPLLVTNQPTLMRSLDR